MSNEIKETVQSAPVRNIPFWICLAASLGLGIAGFLMPPKAVIDGSVLTFTGIMFAFAGLHSITKAIEKGLDAKLKHGNTELSIGEKNNGNG